MIKIICNKIRMFFGRATCPKCKTTIKWNYGWNKWDNCKCGFNLNEERLIDKPTGRQLTQFGSNSNGGKE